MATASITKRAEIARAIMKELQQLDEVSAALYWTRAAKFARLKGSNLWKFAYGDDGGSWSNFCFNELNAPVSSVDQKVSSYMFFVKKHGYKPAELAQYDAYRLYYIAHKKPDASKATITEWMKKSLHMSRKDFILEVSGKSCDHEHVHVEEEKKQVCDACKKVVMKLNPKKKK